MFEKVNPCHPDKAADRIAGALVDMAYEKETDPRIAVEVLIGHGVCHIIAETSVSLDPAEVGRAVHRIAGDLNVIYSEVPQDIILAGNQSGAIRCGDNGIFKGVPVTDEQKKLSGIARDIFSVYNTRTWTKHGRLPYVSYTEQTVPPVPAAAPEFKIGTKVEIKADAVKYNPNSSTIPGWVKSDYYHIVTQVIANGKPVTKGGKTCVLLGKKVKKSGGSELAGINTWVETDNLTVIPGKPAGIYTVQIGAFTDKANADAALKKAQAAGFTDAFIKYTE